MKLVRSWPRNVPPGRACVYDSWPRLVMDNFEYSGLADFEDDVLLIEWDVAVDRDGLDAMVAAVRRQPDRVVVAPYRLYETTLRSQRLRQAVWAHRRGDGSHVDEGEPFCAKFGLGLAYLPKDAIRGFVAEYPGQFSDGSFSGWYANNVTDETPIVWAARATHLHYTVDVKGFDQQEHEVPERVQRPVNVEMVELPEVHPDPIVRALLRERNMVVRRGLADRVIAIDEQLVAHNYRRQTDE